jgi:hypothetical protein
MDVRHVDLRVTGRADRPDRLALGHAVVCGNGDRAEMEQRDGVIVRSPDRHRASVSGQPAGERDAPTRGRAYR